MEQQRQAYKVDGVDETAPAVDLRKRKAEGQEVSLVSYCPHPCLPPPSFASRGADCNQDAKTKKQKADQQPPKERVNTAVYVSSLPFDADRQELHDVFSKYGVIAESLDTNEPRIKLYHDDEGNPKGEALIGKHPFPKPPCPPPS